MYTCAPRLHADLLANTSNPRELNYATFTSVFTCTSRDYGRGLEHAPTNGSTD